MREIQLSKRRRKALFGRDCDITTVQHAADYTLTVWNACYVSTSCTISLFFV